MFSGTNPKTSVQHEFYLRYFKENFNLRFVRPQNDTCIMCEELNLKIKSPSLKESAKRSSVAQLTIHRRCSKNVYILYSLYFVRNYQFCHICCCILKNKFKFSYNNVTFHCLRMKRLFHLFWCKYIL